MLEITKVPYLQHYDDLDVWIRGVRFWKELQIMIVEAMVVLLEG